MSKTYFNNQATLEAVKGMVFKRNNETLAFYLMALELENEKSQVIITDRTSGEIFASGKVKTMRNILGYSYTNKATVLEFSASDDRANKFYIEIVFHTQA